MPGTPSSPTRSAPPTDDGPAGARTVAGRIAAAGTAVTLTAAVVQTVVHLANAWTLDRTLLDVNEEQSVFTWASATLTATAGLGALLLALAQPARRIALLLLASILLFFSLDDAVSLHERAGLAAARFLGLSDTWDSILWPVVYVPLTGGALLLLLGARRNAPAPLTRLFTLGVVALAAAVVAEIASAPISTPGEAENLAHTLEGAVEEALELAGWGLIATAFLAWFAWSIEASPDRRDGPG